MCCCATRAPARRAEDGAIEQQPREATVVWKRHREWFSVPTLAAGDAASSCVVESQRELVRMGKFVFDKQSCVRTQPGKREVVLA